MLTDAHAHVRSTKPREWSAKFGKSSERIAWYIYDAASSVFGTAMSLFIPVLLNTMANEAATGGDVRELRVVLLEYILVVSTTVHP